MKRGLGAAKTAAPIALAAWLLAQPFVAHGQDAPAEDPPIGVVDLHVDLPWQVHFKHRDMALVEGHASAQRLRDGHYVAIVMPIYMPDKAHKDGPHVSDADDVYETITKTIDRNKLFLPLLTPYAEEGRIATFLAIEGGGAFAEDPTAIDRFLEHGLRLVSPCHEHDTKLASSATGGHKVPYGLSDVGKEFANHVYDKGALMDVSHVSDRAFADIAVIAKAHGAPIVATHSNARAIADVPRNLTDEQLREIAATNGVAGVNFYAHFVSGDVDASMADLLKMIDHMVKVAGIEHVALGTDFDGGIHPVDGLEDASTMPKLAAALKKHGMKHEDVMKIFSLNALRVLGWRPTPVWKTTAAAQPASP